MAQFFNVALALAMSLSLHLAYAGGDLGGALVQELPNEGPVAFQETVREIVDARSRVGINAIAGYLGNKLNELISLNANEMEVLFVASETVKLESPDISIKQGLRALVQYVLSRTQEGNAGMAQQMAIFLADTVRTHKSQGVREEAMLELNHMAALLGQDLTTTNGQIAEGVKNAILKAESECPKEHRGDFIMFKFFTSSERELKVLSDSVRDGHYNDKTIKFVEALQRATARLAQSLTLAKVDTHVRMSPRSALSPFHSAVLLDRFATANLFDAVSGQTSRIVDLARGPMSWSNPLAHGVLSESGWIAANPVTEASVNEAQWRIKNAEIRMATNGASILAQALRGLHVRGPGQLRQRRAGAVR